MASEIIDSADLGESEDSNISDWSVPKLISSLRSSFRANDFAKVESVLMSKEEKSRMEIETLKQQKDSFFSKYEDERLQRMNLAEELKKFKKDCVEMGNEVSKLREENMVLRKREKGSDEMCKKLLEELKRMGEKDKEMIDLRSRNIELECAKAKAEAELEILRKRFEELDKRVAQLENDLPLLRNQADSKSNGTENENGISENGRVKPDENVKVEKVSVDTSCESPIKANGHSGNAACMPGSGRPPSQNIVEIVDIDSDEDSAPGEILGEENGTADHKRKRNSFEDVGEHVNDDNDDNTPNGKLKMIKFEEPVSRPNDCVLNHCSMTTISSNSYEVNRDLASPKKDFMVSRQHEQQTESEQKSQNVMNGFPLDGLGFLEESSCSSDSDSDDDNDGVHILFNHSQLAPESRRENRN